MKRKYTSGERSSEWRVSWKEGTPSGWERGMKVLLEGKGCCGRYLEEN